MDDTDANKAFVREMVGSKRSLEDYPDRFDPDLVMREPSTLPFGGTFHGFDEFRRFYPAVRAFYDFDRFELTAVYGDGDTVFAVIQAGLAQSEGSIRIAEQFRFRGQTLVEVTLHICDDSEAAAYLRGLSR